MVAITPNRPHRLNAFTHVMRGELIEALGRSDAAEGGTAFLEKHPEKFPMRVSEDLPDVIPSWLADPYELP
ncbi:hypothetical protein [Streptosporangium sp. NPDC000396]|uniref:hypothetical protein n=1 Tax=Streptosporangium sp. NPDC000396 TaxID=3366185 RepID=UPI0036BF18D9